MILTAAQQTQKNFKSVFNIEKNGHDQFNDLTLLKINLPKRSKMTVVITNSYGKVVDKMISSEHEAGTYIIEFITEKLPKGTYFCHVIADGYTDTKEMEIIK